MVTVFVSDALWADIGPGLSAALPAVEHVRFTPRQVVGSNDVLRIEVACLSSDLWPDSSASFMRVCLDAPNLRWLHSFSAGVDHPVFRMLLDRGVRLTNSSGASARSIAHHVIMNLLVMRRDVPRFLREQAGRQWHTRPVGDVEGTTVGVLGLGPIGLEVARLAAEFGMHPVGIRRTVRGDEPCPTFAFDELPRLLPTFDSLVLALPLTPQTQHVIGAAELALLPAGAHLVNVGRGELLDEIALVDALQTGQVGWASLDVTEVEPLPADSPLWHLPNVIITPHSAGDTASTRRRAMELFTVNVARFVHGEPLLNEVT